MQPEDGTSISGGERSERRYALRGLATGFFVLISAALFLAPPHDLLDKADRYAYAVCHRIGSHSLVIAGRQLPLCARCSGTYLGALAGIAILLAIGRGRANRFPARRFLAVLALFMLAWMVDGLNSYLTFFPGLPHLYEPSNLLRLVTGTLEGLVLAAFVVPLFNMSVWAFTGPVPILTGWRDLGWLVLAGALVVAAVGSEWAPLLYPLALLSGAMVVLLVSLVCAMLLLIILHRDGRAHHWRKLALPLSVGLACGLVGLNTIGLVRDLATAALGLPF